MRKLFITLALVAFAMTANAQWVLGGQVALGHNGAHDDNFTVGSNANTFMTIMPKVGYQLNDNMQVGVLFGLEYNYNRNYTSLAGSEDDYNSWRQSTINIAPYFRYNVLQWRSFTLFCEAQLALGLHMESHNYNATTDTETDNADDFTSLGISVVPGLNYSLSDKVSLDLYCNLARLAADFTFADGWSTHSYGLEANMNAQSLNAHLNNFAIGFNYHF